MKRRTVIMLGEGLDRQGGIVSVEKLILETPFPDIQFRHIPTLPMGSSLYKVWIFSKALVQLIGQLLQGHADVVHIHVSERGSAYRQTLVAWIAQLFSTPAIMHAHGSEFHTFYAGLPGWIQRMMRSVFNRCDALIVLSESWKKFYVETMGIAPQQVVVLPNSVKIPAQIPARDAADPVRFVFLGEIGQRKGAFDLLQAFRDLPAELQARSHLTLAGDGNVAAARQQVSRYNLEQQITILDWIDSAQRDALLAAASAFVLPSYNEGLPMALLEAISWALPVITTPVGGIPEVIINHQTGLLVPPGNIQQLTAALQRLIQDAPLRQQLGQAARNRVLPLGIEHYCETLGALYRDCSIPVSSRLNPL